MEKDRCWVQISRGALQFNVRQLKEYLPEGTHLLAIVKADMYGHGAVAGCRIMEQCGVRDFGVAAVSEGRQLREGGIQGDILVLSYCDEDSWLEAYRLNLIMTAVCPEHARRMNDFAAAHGIKLRVEVKVDTGMRRLGVGSQCPFQDIRALYGQPQLIVNGTFSHLCCADSFDPADEAFTRLQKQRFDHFLDQVRAAGYQPGRTHLCASSGFLNYPEFRYDTVRPGFVLLGYNVGTVHQGYDRRPVLSMYARVEQVKWVEAGEGISYGRVYTTPQRRRIATVSCGYADGYPRRLTGKAEVLIHGQRVKVVGRICMDQFMIDVTDVDQVAPEDIVTLIGQDGSQAIRLEEVAQWAETVGSEIVCNIAPRVPRVLTD